MYKEDKIFWYIVIVFFTVLAIATAVLASIGDQERMIEWLNKFFGEPELYYTDYSLEHIIRCESTHFLFSCVLGWLVFSLTWTILYRRYLNLADHYIFRISLLFGLCASVTVHMCIDAFTKLAQMINMANYNKGKKICDKCRKYFPKSELKTSWRGQFCRKCYDEYHG